MDLLTASLAITLYRADDEIVLSATCGGGVRAPCHRSRVQPLAPPAVADLDLDDCSGDSSRLALDTARPSQRRGTA